jgi:cysteinyl-tRNA synthetase
LQFPHHENELAQSESYSGVPFVRYWMHNGLMKTGNEKMSKSKGNEIVVSELLKRHQPETLRFFLLSTHYRRPIDYSEERLEEVRRGLEGFYRFFERFQRITKGSFHELAAPSRHGPFEAGEMDPEFFAEVARHREAFLEHMSDDFNTGGAIGVLYELLTTLNRFADARQLEKGTPSPALVADFRRGGGVLKELSQILGIFREPPAPAATGDDQLVGQLVQLFIELRTELRKGKNFALADQIRQRLAQLQITLEDRPGGTGWRRG